MTLINSGIVTVKLGDVDEEERSQRVTVEFTFGKVVIDVENGAATIIYSNERLFVRSEASDMHTDSEDDQYLIIRQAKLR